MTTPSKSQGESKIVTNNCHGKKTKNVFSLAFFVAVQKKRSLFYPEYTSIGESKKFFKVENSYF